LPVRLTLSAFLIAVGLGYFSALVQLHFKHAGPGNPLPSPADVIEHFSGVDGDAWLTGKPADEPKPQAATVPAPAVPTPLAGTPAVKIKSLIALRCGWCHNAEGEKPDILLDNFAEMSKYFKPDSTEPKGILYKVLTGDPKKWSKNSMVRAFTDKSDTWDDDVAKTPEAKLRAERETERLLVVAWIDAGAKEAEYNADAFAIPTALASQPLTTELRTTATAAPMPAETKVASTPPTKKKRSAKSKQVSESALTQSTHVHALGFSVLYVLTGLTFAFTSYPVWFRCLVAPIVLLASVADVSCWWLARLDGVGPYFALCIMATGGIVGLGVLAQIVLSLWDMYALKGKLLIALLLALGLIGFGVLWANVLGPRIAKEKAELAAETAPKPEPPKAEVPQAAPVAVAPPAPKGDVVPAKIELLVD
jgi:hypothetical protein